MKLRRFTALSIVMIVALAAVAAPVSAGGWATIELSKPVDSAIVGQPVEFEFQVLQHGMPEKAVVGDTPKVTATHADSGEKLTVTATEPSKGHYLAMMTFDQPGRWKLRAGSTLFSSSSATLPTLHVTTSEVIGTPEAAIPSGATAEVEIINYSFVPSLLEVTVGTTVVFVNNDSAKHEVAFYESSIDDSGMLDQGGEFTVTFTEPGEYHFSCSPHQGMSATIIVK